MSFLRFFYESRRNKIEIGKRNTLAFPTHLHSQIEIVYLLKGSARAYAAGIDCNLEEGDLFIVFPNTIHFYDCCTQDIEALIAIVPYEIFPEYRKELCTMTPKSPLIKKIPSEALWVFEKAVNVTGKFKEQLSRGYISILLGMIFEKTELTPSVKTEKNTVQKIIDYCCLHYQSNISLDDISTALSISKSRISHIFSENLHISFRNFINAFRLNIVAEMLVTTEKTITTIALESGFENTRTFNRAFMKQFGCCPVEYRNKEKKLL